MVEESEVISKEVEIFIKQGGKAHKVILSGDMLADIENLSEKLGTKTILESLLYSVKIISEGINKIETGDHEVELPNGKKISLKFENG